MVNEREHKWMDNNLCGESASGGERYEHSGNEGDEKKSIKEERHKHFYSYVDIILRQQ